MNKDDKKIVQNLMFVVLGMFCFGFALVPLYDVFCEYTGLNGKTGVQYVSEEQMQIDTTREIKVEFLANLNANMPWEFKPLKTAVRVHPGEATKVVYVAKNTSDRDIVGNAVPSVSPGIAAAYFQKTECFCFTEQVLKAGEEKIMPVVFIVDPAIDEDVHEITLSYTFFIKPGSEDAKASVESRSTSGISIASSTPLTQH
ncbi:Cytochrome oxidase biogenesis protein Cox11-CtaG, copper delivery to Cox1 [hydrothermal vent metagenome]|uniref:Cytochrome oxidase biogenesis protein Cox11-CtaG, copper delivery to Cox1 n=1 Tax=hydrothermal vent metagenome TaxID=652676 RepID=A0A3B0WGY5_9ZZZZ